MLTDGDQIRVVYSWQNPHRDIQTLHIASLSCDSRSVCVCVRHGSIGDKFIFIPVAVDEAEEGWSAGPDSGFGGLPQIIHERDGAAMQTAAYSPTEFILASAWSDGSLRLHCTRTGGTLCRVPMEIPDGMPPPKELLFAPDGLCVVVLALRYEDAHMGCWFLPETEPMCPDACIVPFVISPPAMRADAQNKIVSAGRVVAPNTTGPNDTPASSRLDAGAEGSAERFIMRYAEKRLPESDGVIAMSLSPTKRGYAVSPDLSHHFYPEHECLPPPEKTNFWSLPFSSIPCSCLLLPFSPFSFPFLMLCISALMTMVCERTHEYKHMRMRMRTSGW